MVTEFFFIILNVIWAEDQHIDFCKIMWDWKVIMMLQIQLCVTGINYILKYIQIKNVFLIVIFHNITVFTVLSMK